jgi:hypothetical protein
MSIWRPSFVVQVNLIQETNMDAISTRGIGTDSSKTRRRVGIVLSALPVAFLVFDSVMKLMLVPAVVEGTAKLGYPAATARPLGVLLLVSVICYVVPRTAPLGAVLLTGYLGGAIATHVRVGDPLFSHILFPVYVALLLWGGLYLRDERVRALAPWQTRER